MLVSNLHYQEVYLGPKSIRIVVAKAGEIYYESLARSYHPGTAFSLHTERQQTRTCFRRLPGAVCDLHRTRRGTPADIIAQHAT